MNFKFKLDDQDSVEIVQGEERVVELRLMHDDLSPVDFTGAAIRAQFPREDGVGAVSRSSDKLTFLPAAVDIAADSISIPNHGMVADDKVQLTNSGGALPTGLAISTDYYVQVLDKDSIKLAATASLGLVTQAAAIDITAIGSGTNSVEFLPVVIDNDAVLGKAYITLSEAATSALKPGEKQTIEFEYTISGVKRIAELEKALTVVAQSL